MFGAAMMEGNADSSLRRATTALRWGRNGARDSARNDRVLLPSDVGVGSKTIEERFLHCEPAASCGREKRRAGSSVGMTRVVTLCRLVERALHAMPLLREG
jgi:hypothetical protein